MKKRVFKKSALTIICTAIPPCLVSLVIAAAAAHGLDQAAQSSRAEGRRILEDGIRRAVVTCYSIEGNYPDSISYIEEHYGIRIDRAKYAVHYDVFARNIMPVITVIENK